MKDGKDRIRTIRGPGHKKLLNNKLFKTALKTKQEFPIFRSKAKAENKIAK